MYMNTLQPAAGSKPKAKRVGRGPGSGIGKTCGRGQKGQKSRSGGSTRVGFEGGQMSLQRRLPKFGFTSRKSLVREEIRLSELSSLEPGNVSLETLKVAGLVRKQTRYVKVMLSGEINAAYHLKGIPASAGAKAAIEAAGGTVEG